jgi:transcriptional regulator with XRE-family HTH domain
MSAQRMWNIGESIQFARETLMPDEGMSMRELSKRSGISTAQISRIESGAVTKPAANTIVALARALEVHPYPLLILAGHIDANEARERLGVLLAEGTRLADAWTKQGVEDDHDYLGEWGAILRDRGSSIEDLQAVAAQAFVLSRVDRDASDALLELGGNQPGTEDLREAATLWHELTPDRRARVLDFLRDQVTLSQADRGASLERRADTTPGDRQHAI